MPLDPSLALERASSQGDQWQSWRAARLRGEIGDVPVITGQDDEGGFIGPGGKPSPGATGEGVCHLHLLGLAESGATAIAADWLEEARTPAGAWLDSPAEVPGELDEAAAPRVWATASAAAGLLVAGRDPGSTALTLLRGESDQTGRFTGGGYPTFAAAAVYWIVHGPKSELAEWALRWAREEGDEWWGPWERATALTFWIPAGIPLDHPSVEMFLDELRDDAPPEGWADIGLTLRALELMATPSR